jgi:hypothetical protein
MALPYRPNGEYNSLHGNQKVAREAGFSRSIQHELASFCFGGWAIIREICEGYAEWLKKLASLFSAPVIPNETLCVELWRDGAVIGFELKSIERGVVVVDNGRVELIFS